MARGSRRGTEFFCCAIPLINGVYAVIVEVAIVAFLVGVLAVAPPAIVAGLDVIPSFAKDIVAALGFITCVWQIVGIVAVKREAVKLYHTYVRITTLLTLLTLLATIAFTVIAGAQHTKAREACYDKYGAVPTTSSSSSTSGDTAVAENFGDTICNYFLWAQLGTMGGLIVLLGLTQLYCLWCLRAYGVLQRTASRDYKMGLSASAFNAAPEDEIPLSSRPPIPGSYDPYGPGGGYSPAGSATPVYGGGVGKKANTPASGAATPVDGGILQRHHNEPTQVDSGWSAYGNNNGYPAYNASTRQERSGYQSYPSYSQNNERRDW